MLADGLALSPDLKRRSGKTQSSVPRKRFLSCVLLSARRLGLSCSASSLDTRLEILED